jgi:hypothetical protein
VPRRLYFPPSQIERIRASEGARLPVTDRRTEPVALGRVCPRDTQAVGVSGELYGDVTNGLGLEAVPHHIRFTWSRADR